MLKLWSAGIGAGLLLGTLATPCQAQAPDKPFDHLATAKANELEVAYVGHSMKYSITITNDCDWPQNVLGYIETGGRNTFASPLRLKAYESYTMAVTVTPAPAKPGAKAPFQLAVIALVHYQATEGPKTCIAAEAKERLLADSLVPVPAKTMTDLPRSVTASPLRLTQTTKATEPEKKIATTPNQPPAAQMPGDPPAPGNKPTDKPGEKPAEKPPETTGGRPSAAPPQPKADPGRFLPPPPVNKPPLRASPLETPATPVTPTPATGPTPVSGPVSTTPVTPPPAAPGKPATPDGPKPPDKSPPAITTSAPVEGIGDLWDEMFPTPRAGNAPLPPPLLPKTMEDLANEILGKPDEPWTYEQLDRDREHYEQMEMLERFEFEAEPTEVMEPDPIAFIARAGRALLSWLRRPADGASALAAAARPLDSRIARVRGSGGEQVRPQDVSVAFIATGEASGQAFTVKVLNRTGKRVRISLPDGVVLAPAAGSVPARAVNARGTSSHPIVGYCVEHAKQTPSAGALFAVAPPSVQQRYKSVTNVLRSGRLLERFKRLTPQGDAASYGHSVQQWALWTKLEGWSPERFTSQFLERTKKNISEMKGKWNKDVEKAVRDSAVGRWADIGKVLRVAKWIDAHEHELRRQ
jgi:hypothetical protein